MTGSTIKRRVCGVVAWVWLAAAPVAATAESLSDAMIAAYRHSGLLDQTRALLRAADEDVAQAVATLRPIIGWSANITQSEPASGEHLNGSLSLTADLLIYDFGASDLAIEAAKGVVLATREDLVNVEQQVLLRAIQAYMSVRRALAFVDLSQNNEKLINQELRAARDRFEVGEVTRTDVSIAESRLAAAKASVAAQVGVLSVAREEYKAATGQFPGTLSAPPRLPATAKSEGDAKAVAVRTHPDIREAQQNVTVAEINIERARAGMKPKLNASSRISVDDDGEDSYSVGLTLSGTLYSGGALSSLLRQAQARRDAARAGLHTVRHGVEQNVGNAWANLAVAVASIQASDLQITAARVAFLGAQEEARLGARTTLDVLTQQQELLDAQAALISSNTDRYVATYTLLATMGLLTVDHLGLGIATYDPKAYYNAVKNAPVGAVSPQGERLDRVLRALGKN